MSCVVALSGGQIAASTAQLAASRCFRLPITLDAFLGAGIRPRFVGKSRTRLRGVSAMKRMIGTTLAVVVIIGAIGWVKLAVADPPDGSHGTTPLPLPKETAEPPLLPPELPPPVLPGQRGPVPPAPTGIPPVLTQPSSPTQP